MGLHERVVIEGAPAEGGPAMPRSKRHWQVGLVSQGTAVGQPMSYFNFLHEKKDLGTLVSFLSQLGHDKRAYAQGAEIVLFDPKGTKVHVQIPAREVATKSGRMKFLKQVLKAFGMLEESLDEQQPAPVPGSGFIRMRYPTGTPGVDVEVGGDEPDEVARIKKALQWVYPGKRVGDMKEAGMEMGMDLQERVPHQGPYEPKLKEKHLAEPEHHAEIKKRMRELYKWYGDKPNLERIARGSLKRDLTMKRRAERIKASQARKAVATGGKDEKCWGACLLRRAGKAVGRGVKRVLGMSEALLEFREIMAGSSVLDEDFFAKTPPKIDYEFSAKMVEGKHYKFWKVRVSGDELTRWWGRIGTKGQRKHESFGSPYAAQAAAKKLAMSKLAKGYVKVETPKPSLPKPVAKEEVPEGTDLFLHTPPHLNYEWAGTMVEGKHYKFWRVRVAGKTVTRWWGRIGTKGQRKTEVKFNALSFAMNMAQSKMAKGYKVDPAAMKKGHAR